MKSCVSRTVNCPDCGEKMKCVYSAKLVDGTRSAGYTCWLCEKTFRTRNEIVTGVNGGSQNRAKKSRQLSPGVWFIAGRSWSGSE